MHVQTQRFGEIDVPEHAVIQFPDGILGFPQLRRGCLLPYQPRPRCPPCFGTSVPKPPPTPQPEPILRWLQSLDDPSLLFLTVEPYLIFPDYDVELSDADAAALQLDSAEPPGELRPAGELRPGGRRCAPELRPAGELCPAGELRPAAVLTLITISQPGKARRDGGSASRASVSRAAVTTNLLAPIVINTRTRRARQVILDSDRYLTKHIIGVQIEDNLNAGADPKTR